MVVLFCFCFFLLFFFVTIYDTTAFPPSCVCLRSPGGHVSPPPPCSDVTLGLNGTVGAKGGYISMSQQEVGVKYEHGPPKIGLCDSTNGFAIDRYLTCVSRRETTACVSCIYWGIHLT